MYYRVMVTAYGYANIRADNEAEALEIVNDMNEKCFDWDYDFSSNDASIVDAWNDDEN